ncbi:pre-mRNA-processing factor 8 [Nematocida sp. AWRm78]|nr:pre-mRNA-processing factor 8 [Nematocida sp. AWRm79]KAI5182836.1 pre-mRNA-processing factor 8 [Nematocida sp. AWRm78]
MESTAEDIIQGVIPLPSVYLEKMLTDPPRRNKNALFDGLVASSKIISSLVQSIPMPWEDDRALTCVYTTDGIILDCSWKKSEDSINYKCKWLYTLHGCAFRITYPVKTRNYTNKEYKELRKKYPIIKISQKRSKESLFPVLYSSARKVLRDRKSKNDSLFKEDIETKRRTMSRESINVLLVKAQKEVKRQEKRVIQDNSGVKPEDKKNSRYIPPKKEFKSVMEWTKFARLYLSQGRRMLSYVIEERKLKYLQVSDVYTLDASRTLSTKDKKKSRLGQSFHVIQELFKFLARIVAIVEKKKKGEISQEESMKMLFKEFTHVGTTTAIYRYKYSTIRQISETSKMAKLLNVCTEKTKAPYNLMWCEPWRVWALFLLGFTPMLSQRLAEYVQRRREGRQRRKKSVTKQRIKSARDICFKKEIFECISNIIEPQKINLQIIKNTLKNAWKCWKKEENHEEYIKEQITSKSLSSIKHEDIYKIQDLLIEQIENLGIIWYKETVQEWNKYVNCRISNKKEIRKIRARVLRMSMMLNKRTQKFALEKEFSEECSSFSCLFPKEEAERINLLSLSLYSADIMQDILFLSLNRLLSTYKRHLSQEEKREMEYIKTSMNLLPETLARIIKRLTKHKESAPIVIKYTASDLTYTYLIEEKVADSFLEHLMAYYLHKNNLLVHKTLPLDTEPLPVTLYKYAESIREIIEKQHKLEEKQGKTESLYFSSIDLTNASREIDRVSLSNCISNICDSVLTKYIISKCSSTLTYKDITATQRIGISCGLEFYSTVNELILQRIDRILCTLKNNIVMEYFRCGNIVYILHTKGLFDFSTPDLSLLVDLLVPCASNPSYYRNSDFLRELSILEGRLERLPTLLFNIGKKERDLDPIKQGGLEEIINSIKIDSFPISLNVGEFYINLTHTSAYLQSSKEALREHFHLKARNIYYDMTGSSFSIAADRWNRLIIQIVLFFREALTKEFWRIIQRYEEKIKKRIMATVNSRMRKRFSNTMFYAGKETGGLGLISSLVLLQATAPWKDEIVRSSAVYNKILSEMGKASSDRMADSLHKVISSLEKAGVYINQSGIPRVPAFLHKPTRFRADAMWRLRNYHLSGIKRWTTEIHDGHWVPWERYKSLLLRTNAHSIDSSPIHFTNTDCTDLKAQGNLLPLVEQKWTGTQKQYESTVEDPNISKSIICNVEPPKTVIKARLSEAARLPNKMFMLWWSPTINRCKVQVGHPMRIPGTRIDLYGKLSSLRLSYEKLFSNGLWENIHLEIAQKLAQLLETTTLTHGVRSICLVNLNLSLTETLLPSILFDMPDLSLFNGWIALKLRWSDIDTDDISDECEKYLEEMKESASSYTHSENGCVVLVDLRTCEYRVGITNKALSYIDTLFNKSLLHHLSDLPSLNLLKSRISRLVGYSVEEKKVFVPLDMFKYSHGTLLLEISNESAVGINILTGEIYRRKYTADTKFATITQWVGQIVTAHKIHHIFTLPRTCSLLAKSNINAICMPCNINIELTSIPWEVDNPYKHWGKTEPAYSRMRRLFLIMRHVSFFGKEALDLFYKTLPNEEWASIESKLAMEVCMRIKNESNISGKIVADSNQMSNFLDSIAFGIDIKELFVKPYDIEEWRNMTDWRNRYKFSCQDASALDGLLISANNQKDSAALQLDRADKTPSFAINQEILSTLIRISDQLVPMVGFICRSSVYPMRSILITPRQLFSARNFFISFSSNESFVLSAIIQTKTPFSDGITFTYTGIPFAIQSDILILSLDIIHNKCTGNLCEVDSIGDTLSFKPVKDISVCYTKEKSMFLTAVGWNQNIVKHTADPVLIPERPLPFFAEEFRRSHFI